LKNSAKKLLEMHYSYPERQGKAAPGIFQFKRPEEKLQTEGSKTLSTNHVLYEFV
jgi:hypothetical protein